MLMEELGKRAGKVFQDHVQSLALSGIHIIVAFINLSRWIFTSRQSLTAFVRRLLQNLIYDGLNPSYFQP